MQLSDEQRKMAEENHGLIYGFLKKYGLDVDEYYDICAIALCKAVMAYDPERSKSLSTLAYHAMSNEVVSYWVHQNRMMRRGERYNRSLSDVVYRDAIEGDLTLESMLSEPGDDGQSVYYIAVYNSFMDSLSDKEKFVVELKISGFSFAEIGAEIGRSRTTAANILYQVRQKYMAEMEV